MLPSLAACGVLGALTLSGALRSQEVARPDSTLRVQRLAGLGRVWGYAKYMHPALAYGPDLDWDAALVAAVRDVRATSSRDGYAAAVQGMLNRLVDPLTRVEGLVADPDPLGSGTVASELSHHVTSDGILVVRTGDYYALGSPEATATLREIAATEPVARALVLDIRSPGPTDEYARFQLSAAFRELERRLLPDTVETPGVWRRTYLGFEGSSAFSSGQYHSGVFVQAGSRVVPSPEAHAIPVVFVVNAPSGELPSTVPLQAAGQAVVVFDGDPARQELGESETIELGEGLSARIRRSEPVLRDGRSARLLPDVAIARPHEGGVDEALEQALALARAFRPSAVERETLPTSIVSGPERSYPEMDPPPVEYRLLALFRLWSAVEHFYPYKALLDGDWGSVLTDLVPVFEAAGTPRDYALAVARAATRIQDSHAYVSGGAFDREIIRTGYPPVRVRLIEETPVVTALFDTLAARAAGVEVGDIVVAVDGEPAAERLARTASVISASTPWSRTDRASLTFMNGGPGSSVTLTLVDRSGRRKEVTLARRREDYTTLYHRERGGPIVTVLPGNVGYVDLDRLTLDMVEPMFETLRDTKGIVFDMRGYPNGTIWAIAPRLAERTRVVARFETPLVNYPAPALASAYFTQTVEPAEPSSSRYRLPTALLIDERTMSQAEHTGLYLRAANGTTFVGSPSAGADGEITALSLPGGLGVGFTGQSVRFPDGTEVQRRGLVPDVEVRPTIAGIREGVDEVLESAVRLLAEGTERR